MVMAELIIKKRNGGELSSEEIRHIIDGYTKGGIPDYQMSAMLMAIYFNGMNGRETFDLTMAMADSGDKLDLGGILGIKADKHSTGGVGDKTSLVLCPMVASLGIKMAKMSGRGLGHTGGTIDKLESIPGFSCDLSTERFFKIIEEVGFSIAGQTANLDPADKKLYALRDVTGTVDSRPLIVASIMSKKLAAGADIIVLDVKTGSGAFMKDEKEAGALARQMVEIGRRAGKKTAAIITDMDEPLGCAVGNALEVREAIAALKGENAGNLMELCIELGIIILKQAGLADTDIKARDMLEKTISDGSALNKFVEFVKAQGGDERIVYDDAILPKAPFELPVLSRVSGFVKSITADEIGRICMRLGGGRQTKEDVIDPSVGIILRRKVGERIEKGAPLATIYAKDFESAALASAALAECYVITDREPERKPFLKSKIE